MKILHIADVHLDRPFVGMPPDDARDRRRELRNAFDRCLALAAEYDVQVITIGGDLWEDEHVTPDTLRWVQDRLKATDRPVILVTGNHDPLHPGGPYARAAFGERVHVLPAGPGLTEHRVGELSIWGASWERRRPLDASGLRGWHVPEDGRRHILLLHGTCSGITFTDDSTHCPFTTDDVRRAGFQLCLAGHLHGAGLRDDTVAYPGSPEPLGWSETGEHGVVLVDVETAPPTTTFLNVAARRYVDEEVPCDGADSSAAIERAVRSVLDRLESPGGTCLRLRLTGRVKPGCEPDPDGLRQLASDRGLAMFDLRDLTKRAFDLDALAARPGVAGIFIDRIQKRMADNPDDPALERALELGLRALHGDEL